MSCILKATNPWEKFYGQLLKAGFKQQRLKAASNFAPKMQQLFILPDFVRPEWQTPTQFFFSNTSWPWKMELGFWNLNESGFLIDFWKTGSKSEDKEKTYHWKKFWNIRQKNSLKAGQVKMKVLNETLS